MTASTHGGRRAAVARGCSLRAAITHAIAVSPHIRPDGTRHSNAFEARLGGALLCVSETPLLDAARALLAGLAIEDRPSGDPGLRLGKYRQRVTARARIARTPSWLPGQPAANKSFPRARRAGGRT